MKERRITEWSTRREGAALAVMATRWVTGRGQFTVTRRLSARLAAGMERGCHRRLIAGMEQELQQAEWYGLPDAVKRRPKHRPSIDSKNRNARTKPRRA